MNPFLFIVAPIRLIASFFGFIGCGVAWQEIRMLSDGGYRLDMSQMSNEELRDLLPYCRTQEDKNNVLSFIKPEESK